MLDEIRPNMVPPSSLPDLTSVKSGPCPDGRACHPAAPRARHSSRKSSTGRFLIAHHPFGRRVPRPPRQSRPDYRCQEGREPLAFGLVPFGNRTAETLHRSVSGRSSARSMPAVPPLALAAVMPLDCALPASILCQCLDAWHCLSVNRFHPAPPFAKQTPTIRRTHGPTRGDAYRSQRTGTIPVHVQPLSEVRRKPESRCAGLIERPGDHRRA
jgi:hypothetical protein